MTRAGDLDLSPEYLQRLKNRAICEKLSSLGDDVSRPRIIDHIATFDAPIDRDLFVEFILRESFEIVSLSEPDETRSRYETTFSRKDVPSTIDDVVLPLVTKAEALGGIYEGWKCEVIAF